MRSGLASTAILTGTQSLLLWRRGEGRLLPWVLTLTWAGAAVALSVILVGSFVLGPSVAAMQEGGDAELPIVLGSAYDVLALTLATGLSVYKPRLKVTT